MNHPNHFRRPFRHISKDKEGGSNFETMEKREDLLQIEEDPALALIPGGRRKDMLNITNVIPVLHIHR